MLDKYWFNWKLIGLIVGLVIMVVALECAVYGVFAYPSQYDLLAIAGIVIICLSFKQCGEYVRVLTCPHIL